MIPDIETIIESLIAGECTKQEAMHWIGIHMQSENKIGWRKGFNAAVEGGYDA